MGFSLRAKQRYYSKADIDDMLFCEIEELINQE